MRAHFAIHMLFTHVLVGAVTLEKGSVLKEHAPQANGKGSTEDQVAPQISPTCRTLGWKCEDSGIFDFEEGPANWEEGEMNSGRPIFSGCCEDLVCVNGMCEDPDYALFKCTWTEAGVAFAEAEYCDGANPALVKLPPNKNMDGFKCPRVGDPITDFDTYILGFSTNIPSPMKWYAMQKGGVRPKYYDFVDCNLYTLQCTWTEDGVLAYNDTLSCTPQPSLPETPDPYFIPGAGEFGYCGEPFEPKNPGDPATHAQLGNKEDKWYEMAEEGLLNCVTPQQSFVAQSKNKIKSKRIQCGGLPYNCKTQLEARDACKEWSRDFQSNPTGALGTAKGNLCYKYELGDTVGRNCNPMWTEDSNGVEGCYESNNYWDVVAEAMKNQTDQIQTRDDRPLNEDEDDKLRLSTIYLDAPLSRTYADPGCEGNLGDVICYKAPPSDAKGEDNFGITEVNEYKELDTNIEYGRYLGERSYGFDAACCVGHLPDPFRRDRNNPQ